MSKGVVSETMIERVARAICVARGSDPDRGYAINSEFDDGRPEASIAHPAWRDHIAAAKAAIAAMRTPTDAMLDAAVAVGPARSAKRNLGEQIVAEYQAAIDAALSYPSPVRGE